MAPSSATKGSSVISDSNSDTVPRPQAYGKSGRAAASASPARMPTDVSKAELTTAGSPACATMSRARRTPPSGATLTTIRSAAPARATRRGSVSLRTLSSAAISTGAPASRSRVLTSARPSMDGTGCSAYSSPTGASRVSASTAPGTSHPPLASTRTAASGKAARTASSRATSSSSDCPCSATLTLTASTRPNRASTSATRWAATAGTVALTGTDVRSGAGKPCHPASMAAASQREASASPYSGNGQNSPQPAGPWSRRDSRCMIPRNFTRMGRLTTRAPASSSASGGTAWGGLAGAGGRPGLGMPFTVRRRPGAARSLPHHPDGAQRRVGRIGQDHPGL